MHFGEQNNAPQLSEYAFKHSQISYLFLLMQRIALSFISFFLIIYSTACSPKSGGGWTDFIHEDATFVIVADAGIQANHLAEKDYFTYLEDLTPFSMQQLAALNVEFSSVLPLKALVLYPATSVVSHYLWISESEGLDIEEWARNYYEPFAQNNYEFYGYRIHRLLLNGNAIFAAQTGKWLILSKSSFVIENALRTYHGQLKPMDFTRQPEAGSFILNTPALDNWVQQFTKIDTRPAILNSFLGTRPVTLNFAQSDSQNELEITGRLALDSGAHSVLTDAISFENKTVRLDRHIGTNAAAFAILRLPPAAVPAAPELLQSPLDSLVIGNLSLYQQLAATLDNEFAMVAYPESGLTNSGEYLYMRTLQNKSALIAILDRLAADGYITKSESTYFINSSILAELIGSELSVLRDFYLSFSDDVAVIAKRRGLAESVNADRLRSRVMYYDESYSGLRNELPAEKSAFVWLSSGDFLKFIDPLLKPEQVVSSLISRFDMVAINLVENTGAVDVTIKTLQREGSLNPYEELWVLPLSGDNLSAPPVLGNLVGSRADEIVISTTTGDVYVIAGDGTVAMRATTNGLAPVGGPVLYDWYGNGQLVILLPAGNKIFAWNSNGDLLPSFPIELEANISAPILVDDIMRNGVPEIVVATENRKVHVLNNRGNNVNGWPQNTNAVVTEKPVFHQFEGSWSIFAFSENAVHSWLRAGTPRAEFPQFINAQFTGSPMVFGEQILGSAADGYLYSIGRQPFFADTSAVADTLNEIKVNFTSVSGFELASVSLVENVLLRDESGFYREDLLLTVSTNGSVFLYNKEGRLRFTQSLGQPASRTYKPQVIDIDRNRNMDVVVLAEFGRLFAWELLTNERLYGLPTSGMRYPVITDLNSDGQYELIAETREGLRAWTIRRVD